MNKQLLSVKEAMEVLGISRASIYRMFQKGELKKYKLLGKTVVKRTELETFLESGLMEA